MKIVSLDFPTPESRPEILEALRVAMTYASNAAVENVDIRLTFSKGASVVISSDE